MMTSGRRHAGASFSGTTIRAGRARDRLALLHGFSGAADSWGSVVLEGLERAGVDPIALDLPGHGSDVGRRDPAAFTLEATLRRTETESGGAPNVVGYSMGGRIALHYAYRAGPSLRRLILESSSPGLEGEAARMERRAADESLAGRLVEAGIESFVREWEELPLFASRRRLPPEVLAAHRERRLRNDPRSLAAALRGLGTGVLPSLWDRLPALNVPTLLIAGDRDEKFLEIARRMADALPMARLAVVPNAGHTVHLERPDAWLELVTDFLSA